MSVRSGAAASMPGMMDTVLNLGINEQIVESLIKSSANPRWAYDTYRRFIQMFSSGTLITMTLTVIQGRFESLCLTIYAFPC